VNFVPLPRVNTPLASRFCQSIERLSACGLAGVLLVLLLIVLHVLPLCRPLFQIGALVRNLVEFDPVDPQVRSVLVSLCCLRCSATLESCGVCVCRSHHM
jgi:hypothetical protein